MDASQRYRVQNSEGSTDVALGKECKMDLMSKLLGLRLAVVNINGNKYSFPICTFCRLSNDHCCYVAICFFVFYNHSHTACTLEWWNFYMRRRL